MALPSLVKTWLYNVNVAMTAEATAALTGALMLYSIKAALIGFASNAWVVKAASSGTGTYDAMGGAARDLWASKANLVFAAPASNHSWIVLEQAQVAAGFQVCIDCNGTSAARASIVVSPGAGFTGGTATARPTATDEIVLTASAWWSETNANHVLDVWQSSDGQCTRVAVWRASTNLCTFMLFDKSANPVAGWTKPSVSYLSSVTIGIAPTLASMAHPTTLPGRGRGSAVMNIGFTGEGSDSGALMADQATVGSNANDFDASWPITPIGLWSATASNRGRLGSLFDLWWCPTGVAPGDTFPNDATKTMVAMGGLVLPWNGSTPVLA